MKTGDWTPWGQVQDATKLAEGVYFCGTASHGGVYLRGDLNSRIPDAVREPNGWYEEDVDWSIAAMAFPDAFGGEAMMDAERICRDWRPDAYEALTGAPLEVEQSLSLRRRAWQERHAGALQTVAIIHPGEQDGIPADLVVVQASVGGDRSPYVERRTFFVPASEYSDMDAYRARDGQPFVVDPDRHEEVDCSADDRVTRREQSLSPMF